MKTFLNIIKVLIKFILIFMIFFIWLRYYLKSTLSALAISTICSAVVLLIIKSLTKGHEFNQALKAKQKQEAQSMFFSLIKTKDYDFFYRLVKTRNNNVLKKRIYTVIQNENNTIMLYPYLKINKLSQDDILSIYQTAKKEKVDKVVICAIEIDQNCINFSKSLEKDFVLLDQYMTYQYLFSEYDFYPEITTQAEPQKKAKQFLQFAFSKVKAKGYLLSALILLMISFVFKQNLYYCIVATLLLFFALICIILPNKKTCPSEII